MDNSPVTFIIIGVLILVGALVLGRMLRKPLGRQMPGHDRDGARPQAWWIGGHGGGGQHRDGGFHDGGDGGGGGD